MLLAKVQELQNSIPELEVKCDNLAEKESQLRELIERLEVEKGELITMKDELTAERDNLLTRCEEFTQTIYEYDVQKITMAGKMEELQNKLEVKFVCGLSFFASISLASLSLRDIAEVWVRHSEANSRQCLILETSIAIAFVHKKHMNQLNISSCIICHSIQSPLQNSQYRIQRMKVRD